MLSNILKKAISFIVAIALLTTTLSLPALAADTEGELASGESLYGYTFTENYLSDDKIELYSYYNGELQKKYTIEAGDPLIYVEVFKAPASRTAAQNNYTITKPELIKSAQIVPYAEQWAVLGYINYKEHGTLGYVRGYTSAYGDTSKTYYNLNQRPGTPLDDIVAILEGFLLEAGITELAIAMGASVSGWGAALLLSIIASLGIEIINGCIADILSDKVEAMITYWDFRVSSFADNDYAHGKDVYLYDQGNTLTIMHTGNVEWETLYDGITINNWQSNTLALLAWNKMFPNYQCPGISGFSRF